MRQGQEHHTYFLILRLYDIGSVTLLAHAAKKCTIKFLYSGIFVAWVESDLFRALPKNESLL